MLEDPAPSVAVSQLAEAGIQVTVFAWAKTYELGDTRTALVMAISERMEALGMSLSTPPRDIRLVQDDTEAAHPPA